MFYFLYCFTFLNVLGVGSQSCVLPRTPPLDAHVVTRLHVLIFCVNAPRLQVPLSTPQNPRGGGELLEEAKARFPTLDHNKMSTTWLCDDIFHL